MTGDSEKVFHRSLDILYLWIRDCKQVDFTPESKLVDTLEQFLNAEVTIEFLTCFRCFHFLPLIIVCGKCEHFVV